MFVDYITIENINVSGGYAFFFDSNKSDSKVTVYAADTIAHWLSVNNNSPITRAKYANGFRNSEAYKIAADKKARVANILRNLKTKKDNNASIIKFLVGFANIPADAFLYFTKSKGASVPYDSPSNITHPMQELLKHPNITLDELNVIMLGFSKAYKNVKSEADANNSILDRTELNRMETKLQQNLEYIRDLLKDYDTQSKRNGWDETELTNKIKADGEFGTLEKENGELRVRIGALKQKVEAAERALQEKLKPIEQEYKAFVKHVIVSTIDAHLKYNSDLIKALISNRSMDIDTSDGVYSHTRWLSVFSEMWKQDHMLNTAVPFLHYARSSGDQETIDYIQELFPRVVADESKIGASIFSMVKVDINYYGLEDGKYPFLDNLALLSTDAEQAKHSVPFAPELANHPILPFLIATNLIDIYSLNKEGQSYVIQLVKLGKQELVANIITAGKKEYECADFTRTNLLMHAAENGALEIVKKLVRYENIKNSVNIYGYGAARFSKTPEIWKWIYGGLKFDLLTNNKSIVFVEAKEKRAKNATVVSTHVVPVDKTKIKCVADLIADPFDSKNSVGLDVLFYERNNNVRTWKKMTQLVDGNWIESHAFEKNNPLEIDIIEYSFKAVTA